MKKKIKKFIKDDKVFWIVIVFASIWLVFYIDYLVNKDLEVFFKMGRKYSLIVLGILLVEFLYKKIRNYFQE